jgi:hypothetical protein
MGKCLEYAVNFRHAYDIYELLHVLKEIMMSEPYPQANVFHHDILSTKTGGD